MFLQVRQGVAAVEARLASGRVASQSDDGEDLASWRLSAQCASPVMSSTPYYHFRKYVLVAVGFGKG